MAKRDDPKALEPQVSRGEVKVTTLEHTAESTRPAPAELGRRKYSRHQVDLEVTLGSEHNFYAGLARNMSAGGLFVATHNWKPPGERISFRIELPDSGAVVEGVGVVRWVREYADASDTWPGMGIEFVELAPGGLAAVEAFLVSREPLLFE